MIFVDSNIPMYLIGAAHPKKTEAQVLSARDAIHIAIMERQAIRSILSFDSDFDRWPGLRRVHRV